MTVFDVAKRGRTNGSDRSATGGWLGRFWRDQSGAMSYLAIAGAMVMMVFGGIGVDLIYAEMKRTKLQNTLDRAVLAAANLDNDLDAKFTVEEYMRAMGLSDALGPVTAPKLAGETAVTAEGTISTPSNFISLLGYDNLSIKAKSQAAMALSNLEISLVLDVSNSMNGIVYDDSGNAVMADSTTYLTKIAALKKAAGSFLDTVLGDGNGTVSVNLVPYNHTVNMGPRASGLLRPRRPA